MSFFISIRFHLSFLIPIFLSWVFSSYSIFLLLLASYLSILYLSRIRSYRGEPELESVYSPVSGKVMEIRKGVSHPCFGDHLTQIRISLPWWKDWGVYFPFRGEVMEITNLEDRRFYRFSKKSSLINLGTCFNFKDNLGKCIGVQSVKCFLGGSLNFNILPGDKGRARALFGILNFGGGVSLYLPQSYQVTCLDKSWVSGAESVIARVIQETT